MQGPSPSCPLWRMLAQTTSGSCEQPMPLAWRQQGLYMDKHNTSSLVHVGSTHQDRSWHTHTHN